MIHRRLRARGRERVQGLVSALAALLVAFVSDPCARCLGQPFEGFDSTVLSHVTDTTGDWGLKVVVFNVGQADAILVLTPNGDVCVIDAGTASAGDRIADCLGSKTLNAVGNLKTIDLLYATHYDRDHIGGIAKLVERGIRIRKAFDQGTSKKRTDMPTYKKYVAAVGDKNGDLIQDDDEGEFIRHKIHHGHVEHIGLEDEVEIHCVSVRGDTKGEDHDLDLDPANKSIDENPGSIALVIRLGEFELYTAGDQTDDDWRSEPTVEEAVVASGAIPGGSDIDVLKVSHHGPDTSNSPAFIQP